MQRIGIYGGTYNPPHLGHFRAAEYACGSLKLDKLLMIPTNIPPHKQLPEGSPTPAERLEMVRLGAEDFEKLEACDLELRREGASYTWQTVAQLREEYPNAQLYLLMGTDMFLSFGSWREPQRILQDATLAVFYRGEPGEKAVIDAQKRSLEEMGARVELVENPVTDISSTELRRMLTLRCASEFLPASVERYVYEHGFYGTHRQLHDLSEEDLERVVTQLLKPSRVPHVLGCRDTAVMLAKRWGADVTDAARAALLHDITKVFDGPLQLTLARSYGMILDDFSARNTKTLHALTGSWVAQRIFGENKAVVDAIASHTTGKPGMNVLETIIYVADYMEPNRDFPGVEALRELAYKDLYGALELGLNMTITHLQQQGREISSESGNTLRWLRSEERKIL